MRSRNLLIIIVELLHFYEFHRRQPLVRPSELFIVQFRHRFGHGSVKHIALVVYRGLLFGAFTTLCSEILMTLGTDIDT